MKLTPLDIHHKEFRRGIRGYNEEEVDVFLDQIAEEFERLFKENMELKEEIEGMAGQVKQYEGVGQTLQNTLLTAQQAADEVQKSAKKESELIIQDAESKAKEIIQQVLAEKQKVLNEFNMLKGAEVDFRNKFKNLLVQYLDVIGKVEKGEEPQVVESAPEPRPEVSSEPAQAPEAAKPEEEPTPIPEEPAKPEAQAQAPAPVEPETPKSGFGALPPDIGGSAFFGPEEKPNPAEVAPPASPEPIISEPKPVSVGEQETVATPAPSEQTGPAVGDTRNSGDQSAYVAPRVSAPEVTVQVPEPIFDVPAVVAEPEVPEFDPASVGQSVEPAPPAPSVSNFFDDDLGVDEEEKNQQADWSMYPGGAPENPNPGGEPI